MSFRCDIPCIVCAPSIGGGVGPVDPANPFVNLSSETPDVDDFIGRRYSVGKPPLGSTWYAVGCLGWCLSEDSQEAADLCAAEQAVFCQSVNWPQIVPNPNPNLPDIPVPRTVFFSNAQACSFQCPDGSFYNFTTVAGLFATTVNQETADLMAYSYACNKAVTNHMCLGTLTPARTCSSSIYNGSITASTSNTPVSFEIVGVLPDGLLLAQNEATAFIQGTPTTPGDYSFTIRATDSLGQSIEKVVGLTVFGVSTLTPMPEASVGNPYSETLQYGGTPSGAVSWSIINGTLPDGLTLDTSTGEISGTPTTEETQSFTVSVTDGTITCSKQIAIEVVNAGCPDWDAELLWGTPSLFTQDGASATFTPDSIPSGTFQAMGSVTGVFESQAGSNNSALMDYNAGGCDCNLHVDLINNVIGGAFNNCSVTIFTLNTGILITHEFINDVGGSYDFPFSIPDTLGVPDQIVVQVNLAKYYLAGASTTQIDAVITNV